MTRIGKNRRKLSANQYERFHSRKNRAAIYIGSSPEFSPVLQG
jgi:hypothetical protein